MGQAESKRATNPQIQVQTTEQKFLSAHHPERARTPTSPAKVLLNVPTTKHRRKSLDTAIEEISKSFEEKPDPVPSLLTVETPEIKIKKPPKSPIFSMRSKLVISKIIQKS